MASALLLARRTRGWSAPRLAEEIRLAAKQLDIVVASPNSLRVMISRWENGRSRPDARTLVLLQHVFGLPPDALGFDNEPDDFIGNASEPCGPHSSSRRRSEFGAEKLEYFESELGRHVRMDNAAGALFVMDTTVVQLRQIQMYAGDGCPEANLLASRYAEFLGWLMHDSGKAEDGLKHTEQAVNFALLAGDTAMTAYTLMRKSNILTSLFRRTEAVAVAQQASSLAASECPDLLPVCLRQVALSCAQLGDETRFRTAFEQAISLTCTAVDKKNSLSSYCTTSYLEMEAALCWLTLKKPKLAISACERALKDWPSSLVRDEALCHARRAIAYAELGQPEDACEFAALAIAKIQLAPSARTIHMLRLTARRLEPFQRNAAVRDMKEALADVA